jgi:hypothetical protein
MTRRVTFKHCFSFYRQVDFPRRNPILLGQAIRQNDRFLPVKEIQRQAAEETG